MACPGEQLLGVLSLRCQTGIHERVSDLGRNDTMQEELRLSDPSVFTQWSIEFRGNRQ